MQLCPSQSSQNDDQNQESAGSRGSGGTGRYYGDFETYNRCSRPIASGFGAVACLPSPQSPFLCSETTRINRLPVLEADRPELIHVCRPSCPIRYQDFQESAGSQRSGGTERYHPMLEAGCERYRSRSSNIKPPESLDRIIITKSTYLGAQSELGGNLLIFYHETHAPGRLQLVLEPQRVSR